ncbi:MAG TPA: glycoside hydrolase family 88 protein [Oceanipulchritudo sp.]|nr:glycoside hydrolase family 88 protein [Oceanipulchritudo sp.]
MPWLMKRTLSPFPVFLLIAAQAVWGPPVGAQLTAPDAKQAAGLWREPSTYPIRYEPAEVAGIADVLQRVTDYLGRNSPVRLVDLATGEPIEGEADSVPHPGLERGLFSIISYEWGVTYAGMLRAWEVTADERYFNYSRERLEILGKLGNHYRALSLADRPRRYPVMGLMQPRSLDNCGAMAAALIKWRQAGFSADLEPLIQASLDYISTGEHRLADGTLARNRPMPDSLWLDDLYMSVPALAQMGRFTGDNAYFDDACRQILQFAKRMFVPETGLYRHGWVLDMEPHPYFPWNRANGWAAMATVELLSVLPAEHPSRPAIMELFHQHIAGLARAQGINGLWHQLLDRPSTYEETSGSAMFVFAMARGINRGWIDAKAYGPVASLGWNAVAAKVNASGQVEGTCVGTGMGWDPAFYAYRNTSVMAAHGYGPVLLAGAEMIELRKNLGSKARVHDGAVHYGETPDW